MEYIGDYESWMIVGINNLEMVFKFSQSGFFVSEVGDFCVRVIVKFLRILIIIVIVFLNLLIILFLFDVFVIDKLIYVVYDYFGFGYYNVMKGM